MYIDNVTTKIFMKILSIFYFEQAGYILYEISLNSESRSTTVFTIWGNQPWLNLGNYI